MTSSGRSSLPACSESGRSDQTHALTSVSTSSSAARLTTPGGLISADDLGRSIDGTRRPRPEQYDHCVT